MTDIGPGKALLKKAGELLARRAFSRAELQRRLAKFFPSEDLKPALDRLESLNLLNDTEYAYNFGLRQMKEYGWGYRKIRDALVRQGVMPLRIDSVIERLRDELGETETLKEYIKRHCRKSGLPHDPRGLRRLVAGLQRRGFSAGVIRQVLSEEIPAALCQDWELGD